MDGGLRYLQRVQYLRVIGQPNKPSFATHFYKVLNGETIARDV
jgi:hypothetical protein